MALRFDGASACVATAAPASAGLLQNDVITHVGGVRVRSGAHAQTLVAEVPLSEALVIAVDRATTDEVLLTRPGSAGSSFGLELASWEDERGIGRLWVAHVVEAINGVPTPAAASMRLCRGARIEAVNRVACTSAKATAKLLAALPPGGVAALRVAHGPMPPWPDEVSDGAHGIINTVHFSK